MNAIPLAARQAVQPSLIKGAEEIAATIKSLAPEATGKLKESITVTAPGQATPAYSQPGGSTVAPSNAALVTAGNTDVRYPHLVEYGTTKNPAHPFFWPGFRLARDRAARRVKRAIGKAIKEAK